ncbi:MAG: hypothetical protein KC910_13150 [Candidatus Eremiobacteraeota bacterium]|nr:hypothetical protein [Candidatus Eremiobacteraeota bacterium]
MRSYGWLCLVLVTIAGWAWLSHFPRPVASTSDIVACTAEDIYGSDLVASGCRNQIENLARAAQSERQLTGHWPQELMHAPACAADGGKAPVYEIDPVHDRILIYCPGQAHAKLGLPPDYPRYDSEKGILLHPPVQHLTEGGLNMAHLRPGMSIEQAEQTAGPDLKLLRLTHIYTLSGPTHTVILDSRREVAFLQGSALASEGKVALCVGDTRSEAYRLLGPPLSSGPTGQFPPRGELFRVDGLDVHIDFRDRRVDRIYLTTPDYSPEWALWKE